MMLNIQNYLFYVLLLVSSTVLAQPPKGFNYQAAIRDASGKPLANTQLEIESRLLSNQRTVYAEKQTVRTDGFGLVNLVVGNGTVMEGNFNTVNWSEAIHFKCIVNGIPFVEQPILTVPTAIFAQQSADWQHTGNDLYRTSGQLGIGKVPEATLDVSGNAIVRGFTLEHQGGDFKLGTNDTRSIGNNPEQRALVHNTGDQLVINYAGDFEGGVAIHGPRVETTGRIIVDLRAESGTTGRDGFFMHASADNDEGVFLVNKPRFSFWSNSDNRFADVQVGKIYAERDASVTTLEIRGGNDIVEMRNSPEKLLPGELVICDPNNPSVVHRASKAYDKRVIGVVSGAGGIHTGMALSQTGKLDGDIPIAMVGTVKVKVIGAVEAGDLITTSDTPGAAMAAKDPQKAWGTVVGKAITNVDADGYVTVIVQFH